VSLSDGEKSRLKSPSSGEQMAQACAIVCFRSARNDWSLFSWQAYKLFRDDTPAFEQLAAFQIGQHNAHLSVRRVGSPAPLATANGD
jgi:hypothetical protein